MGPEKSPQICPVILGEAQAGGCPSLEAGGGGRGGSGPLRE